MANISDVSLTVQATNCAKEFKEFLDTVDKKAYYDLCSYSNFDIDGDNCSNITGEASGRWSYDNNLENYFPEPETLNKESGWLNDKAVVAYKKLLKAIADNDGRLEFDYNEIEGGYGFIGTGELIIEHGENGEIEISRGYEEYDYCIENLIEYCGHDEKEAKEYMGEE
jgi:hypothetical protein